MDWNLFWTAFGAIGGTISALATFAAVIVALWQTKFSYRKKIKLSFDDNTTIVMGNGNECYHCVSITVINVGNRDVVIKNWGFKLDDNSQMLIVVDPLLCSIGVQVNLPHKLQIEESITLYYKRSLFYNALLDCRKKGTLKENEKIKFYVTDSTNQEHCLLTNKTASELINYIGSKNEKN